jgi:hypothetical protein
MDSLCSKLHSEGVGAVKKSAEVFSFEDEECLWLKGVMGVDSPSALFNAVFFYVGLNFCLRGGQEHRNLSINQFQRHPQDMEIYNQDTFYEYSEYISKNNQHRFKDIHTKNKVVKGYANIDSTKCIVKILDKYFSSIPSNPKAFYLRPSNHDIIKHPEKVWFINIPVGVNTLNTAVASMCEKAELSVKYTNHSLRATSATRMYTQNVPEKMIAEKTGHKSLVGLRAYERTTTVQERSLSKTLVDPSHSFVDVAQNPSVESDKPENESSLPKPSTLPVITGTLNSCVFNFYQK